MNEIRETKANLEVYVPLRARIFSIIFFSILTALFFVLAMQVPKYGLVLGRDILGLKEYLNIRLPQHYLTYPLYGLMTFSLAYLSYIVLELKAKVYSFNKLNITNTKGFLTTTTDTMDLVHIVDQRERRTVLDKLLGISSIKIDSKDKSDAVLNIDGILKGDAANILVFLKQNVYVNYTDYRVKKDVEKKDLLQEKQDLDYDKEVD